ncbi:ATP-binding protein [Synergistales bacterium]|nr:ATP-binding protein [Synergistales bacterium]
MSDTENSAARTDSPVFAKPKSNVPKFDVLENQLAEASLLVDDIVLKNYLSKLTSLDIVPLDESMKKISDIRLFKINEMVYQNDEYSTYKFASVFNSVQNLNCGVFIIAYSNGEKTDFYMGVRSLDKERGTTSLKDTLRNALCGHFPGVKAVDLLDEITEGKPIPKGYHYVAAKDFLANLSSKNIASVSCVAKNKDEEFKDNERFIQGLEKLALAMQGKRYTAIVLAKSTPTEQLAETRRAYETIYTQLSPFANMQLSYGTNTALNISDAFSSGTTTGTSHSTNKSTQTGSSYSKGTSANESESKADTKAMLTKSIGSALLGVASIVAAPLTGGASLVAAGVLMAGQLGLSAINPSTKTKGTATSENYTENTSETTGESDSTNESKSENQTKTKGLTSGVSDNMQLTMQNKTLINTLERIDLQLKRIDECESLGMWECAAYFLSDSRATAEMAAGTYKALMKGEKSGVETSAINFWGHNDTKQLQLLREYITNFIHPVFEYRSEHTVVPVTASSLISGNELAIQMGLPRKSVCGFPVIEHADFGKEVVKYNRHGGDHNFVLGNVFSMGSETNTAVKLDRDSMTMHTFITGSTGAGKSNTVYEILSQLSSDECKIPFLVIEPAKGEYKDVFGGRGNVTVYGTNPFKSPHLLQINPFSFPDDTHVLEHIDRLVEVFNACWPMYAAMPAILKESVEKSYEECGWNLKTSKNAGVYPTFDTLLAILPKVVDSSAYSADTSNDYKGALVTRIRSLNRGIHGQIFKSDVPSETLFNSNVIVDLSRVGSQETKALIMGILVLKLQEFRMSEDIEHNSGLRHITVLEEAHNLLRRTSSEQSQESSNLQGKSVEMLANAIAEMRTYGEGFIIADQSPGLMDMSVIRNTNTKIIMRLPDEGDRKLVGKAAGLNDSQVDELSLLEQGVAAISQSDWLEPVLCKVDKFTDKHSLKERFKTDTFDWTDDENSAIQQFLRVALDVEHTKLTKDVVDKVRNWYGILGLSQKARDVFENVLEGNNIDDKQKLLLVYYVVGSKLKGIVVREDAIAEVNQALSGKYGVEENSEVIRRINKLFLLYFPLNAVLDNTVEQVEKLGREGKPL